MKKIKVIIPANSEHYIIEHTIATLLDKVDQDKFDISIHLGLHSNYDHYTNNLSIFNNLEGFVDIHLVDELNWDEHNANSYRYSLMHSLNLINLINHVKHYQFDYLAILDNDLDIKGDLFSDLLSDDPDLVCALLNDKHEPIDVTESGSGDEVKFMPKMSIWHTIMSRKLFDHLANKPKLLKPHKVGNIVYDTSARFYDSIKNNQDFKIKVLKEDHFKEYVHHFTCSSFNYGWWAHERDYKKYSRNVASIKDKYEEAFPEGIREILKEYGRKRLR